MSKQTDLMELEKCIVSRLWYVATILHQRELTDRCRNRRNAKELKNLIATCAEQGIEEHKWIAYNLSSQIENDDETRKSLAHQEFACTLTLLDTRIPHNSREELLRLFEAVRAAVQKTDVSICQLSQETLQCLETNMLESPALIHWIIEGLLCIWLPTSFAQTDLILQNVYFGSMRKLLDAFSPIDLEANNVEDTISLGFRKNTNSLDNVHLGVLLSILSKLDLTDAKEDEMIAWLYPALLETTNPDDIELALYSRKNLKFFRAWHVFLDDTYARCHEPGNLESALKISRIMFKLNENLSVSLNAKEIFKRMLRRQTHWLTDIFEICYVLLINERHREVEKILATPVLNDFWLPLLFKLLKDCPSVCSLSNDEKSENSTAIRDALSFVLKKLAANIRNDSTLEHLTRTLENHLNVCDWILANKQISITNNSSTVSNANFTNFGVKHALNLLQNHSVLAVLKMTTNIHEKPYEDIYNLLSDTETSRKTFQAYYTMLCALRGILECEFYNEKYARVAEHLNDMEKSLGSLFPLDLRLQVIENIFSMLFLRYEDFSESDSCLDIGEEDCSFEARENSEKTKNFVPSEIGFMCNKYAMREILYRLGRSVKGLELEYAEEKNNDALSIEYCESLEKSIKNISKILVDATWRLELLTSFDYIERRGMPDVDDRKWQIFNNRGSSRDGIIGSSANSKSKTFFYKPSDTSSDESELLRSDMEGSSEAGSQGNTTSNRRRKRLKNQSSPLNEGSSIISRVSKKRERTLNCMLASNESLVLQCLWKSDYDRASQVIEMFGLKNSRLDGEILFSRAMRAFRKELRAQWNNLDGVDSTDGVSEQSTLENIRRAVQDGFQTSRTTSQIETFLASQESSVRLLNSDTTSAKDILTMASLDLALTMSRTHQDSINLSDVTMKYLESCKKFANTRHQIFFESIHHLLWENKCDLSIKKILCDARIPLSVKEAREKSDYWSRLMKKIDAFRISLVDRGENNFDESTSDNSMNSSEKSFQDVMSVCENGELYLPRVYAYLKLLRTIVPKNYENVDDNLHLFETSLNTCIGDQIFRLNIELEEIESIASRLGVNLVHSILVNCCPKLSCFPEICRNETDTWGFVILNKIRRENNSIDRITYEANQCVRDILSELVEAIGEEISTNNFTLRHEEAREFSKKPKIRHVLSKTRRLATLDLSNLSFGHHTLAFFINVWNLLMIHAILDIWSKEPPIDDLRHEISLTSVGYEIGDLGTVSLAALRSKLLGQSKLWGSRYFNQTEELNEPAWQDLDVPYEPRSIFAMINEYEDSPIVRIYGLKTLDDDLQTSMIDYVDYHGNRVTNLQRSSGKIAFIPELVELYDRLNEKKSKSSTDERIINSENENNATIDAKVSHVSPRYCYQIIFSYNEESSSNRDICKINEKTSDEFPWQSRIVKSSLLHYLEGHCWLLSYLVQRIHEESPTLLDGNFENLGRTAALENLLKSTWTNGLKCLYENNETVAGLHKIPPIREIWKTLETLLANDETTKCMEIFNSLPDSLIHNNIEIQRLRDKILARLTISSRERNISDTMRYVYQIRDVHVLAQMILENANDLPVKVCQESLLHALSHGNSEKLPLHCKTRMNEILCRVTVFHKMLPYCKKKRSNDDDESWHDIVYHTEINNPVRIVKSLMEANQYELCLEWLEYQAVSSEIHSLITQDLLVGLLTNDDNDFKHSLKLLQALPVKKSLNLCNGVIGKLESIGALRFVVGYILDNTSSCDKSRYRRDLLGIDILEKLDVKERRSYVHLIDQPLLMLEQLLMNCRLDSLQRIIIAIGEKSTKFHVYAKNFDEIVRFYAKKSLDFSVAVQADAFERIKDASTSSNKSQNGDFAMPINIPTKEEWVPNDKARECSCCRVVIFSMFNRRHHCRRCGRVVCGACSAQRMRLPSYPISVPVRICNDCKRQSLAQMQASTPNSVTFDCWRLSVDEAHNKTLRDEFSFENAPNISLCLAILNLHSDHEAYSNFLLDRCDEMKSLLRPDSEGRVNREIDHALIIKMIRSLLVAAKVKCAEIGLNTGLTHCDRFLSQVDLIATLINSDCSYLIPRIDKDDHLDDHTLRRLRDMLTEKEQWTLALDVSTKTGLDTQGVWAAWGTACLKAGYYERARDKFTHCLDKVLREDFDDWVLLSYPGESSNDRNKRLGDSWSLLDDSGRKGTNSKCQEGLKNRPSKDPPLLTEILQILDRTSPNDTYGRQNTTSNSNVAQEIMNTLSSLKAISQGHCAIGQSSGGTKNFRYQESLYYLLMYGSYNSVLDFFVRHEEYDKCLDYILDNNVEPELFMSSVFLNCLRNERVTILCESMRTMDPSLVKFKKYLIYTCHSLERKQLLHTLHQLQIFMKDYVRASMTCIRFYVTDATTYEDLCTRNRLLVDAQKYLASELQLENFVKKRRRSFSSPISGSNSLNLEMDPVEIDRHMNTISRQMEVAKFLGNREQEGKSVSDYMNKLSCMDSEGTLTRAVPTLFGNQQEKTHLAVLAILCGRNVEEGFGIAFRIMQDYNLRPQKIYSLVGHMLALDRKISSIEQLIKCCRSSGSPNSSAISDRVLAHCVKLLLNRSRADYKPSPKDQIDTLIRIITDVELKIESYIESRQLKAAYLLAVKHSRAQDIRKILKEADRLGQLAIKSICTKWLQQTEKTRGDL